LFSSWLIYIVLADKTLVRCVLDGIGLSAGFLRPLYKYRTYLSTNCWYFLLCILGCLKWASLWLVILSNTIV